LTSAKPAAGATARESPLAQAADFGRRLYRKGVKDDVLFLAGGVAFNILLAGVPFFLLLASGLGYALGTSDAASSGAVGVFVTDLFPGALSGKGSLLDPIISDIVRTRGTAGALGAVAFLWFSTRLFGSLSTVFRRVFDVPTGRGIIHGILFDLWMTIAATALVVAWIVTSAYIALARTRGVAFLASMGLHSDVVMRPIAYGTGRLVTFGLLVAIFYALYEVLPFRKVRWQQAIFGALTSAVLFEIARWVFNWVVHRWNPATLYTGTLAAIIVVVFWIYYGALIVIIGGAASQVREERHEARLQG
jgi:membrane protein